MPSGGGGGSLGIITSFTIQTYPVPEMVTIFTTNWDLSDTMPTLGWWQEHAPAWPAELGTDFQVFSSNAQFSGMYLGPSSDLMAILNNTGYQDLPAKQSEDFQELPYIAALLHNAASSQGLKPAEDINSLALGPGDTVFFRMLLELLL